MIPEPFASAYVAAREQIARRVFGRPELKAIEAVLLLSLARGEARAQIPGSNWLARAIGEQASHMSETLRGLARKRVLAQVSAGEWVLNVNFRAWLAPEIQGMNWALLGVQGELAAVTGAFPDLRSALVENFIEFGGRCAAEGPMPDREAFQIRAPGQIGPGPDVDPAPVARAAAGPNEWRPGQDHPDPACPSRQNNSATVPKTGTVPKRGTPARLDAEGVPVFGTVAAEACKHDGFGGVPKTGTPAGASASKVSPLYPPSKTLNDKRLSFNDAKAAGVPKKGTRAYGALRPAPVTFDEERRLMELITGFVGRDDMIAWGGMWRCRVVRSLRSEIIEECVANGRDRASTGYKFETTPGRWLFGDIAKLAGFKRVSNIPPGPEPR